jgi:hypothetical protein
MKGLAISPGHGLRTGSQHCTPIAPRRLASSRATADSSVERRPQKERPGRHGGGLSGTKPPAGLFQKQGATRAPTLDRSKVDEFPKEPIGGSPPRRAAKNVGIGRGNNASPASLDWDRAGSAPKREEPRTRAAGPVSGDLDWDDYGIFSDSSTSTPSPSPASAQEGQGTPANRGTVLEPAWMSWGPSIPQQETGVTSAPAPSQRRRDAESQAQLPPGSKGAGFEGRSTSRERGEGRGTPRERGIGGQYLGSEGQHSRRQPGGNTWDMSSVGTEKHQDQPRGRPNRVHSLL